MPIHAPQALASLAMRPFGMPALPKRTIDTIGVLRDRMTPALTPGGPQ